MHNYAGDFEIHVTVQAVAKAEVDRFRVWCRDRGLKCVRIVLSRGDHPEQPMATWTIHDSVLPAVTASANGVAEDAASEGFDVVRVKVEASPFNSEIPVSAADAADHPSENYFEHHVKLRRHTAAPSERLLAICDQTGAHLSRNAFRSFSDGQEERFVTLRAYAVGRTMSENSLHHLLDLLSDLDEAVVEQESEYCVYDSNLALDAGWLAAN